MNKHQTKAAWAEELFLRYEQKLYAAAYAILHDEGRAEDAVMDAMERLVKMEGAQLAPESDDMKRLLIKVIQSCAIDIYRKAARERDRIVSVDESTLANMPDNPQPDTTLGSEVTQEAQALFGELPAHYQSVLRKRLIEERSVNETAADLGISPANVRKRQERALTALRKHMEGSHGLI